MASTFTPNKTIQQPANGDFSGDWNVPVNADWTIIDTAFGGTTALSVTSQSGTINLTATQLQPLIINFTGTLTANLNYQIPAAIGGQWIINNATTGAFTITISWASGGETVVVPQGKIVTIYNDNSGGGVSLSNTAVPPVAANTQVIYNSGGTLTGNSNLTYDGTTLTANAVTVNTNADINGSANAAEVVSAGTVTSQSGGFVFPDSSTQTTAASSSPIPAVVIFTNSGTWSVPAGVTRCKVTIVAGGGGGASNPGGGGGAGGTVILWTTVTPAASIGIIIGGGGAPDGGGGNSAWTPSGVDAVATGGGPGLAYNASGAVGYGGFGGSSGTLSTPGSALVIGGGTGGGGGYAPNGLGGYIYMYGAGGSAALGGGGLGAFSTAGNIGGAASGWGGGGGGAAAGGQGIVIIEH